mmetsp:Transcript_6990/g.12547  ORF Transcript_6990/g.12547 Transcript_6990/m.12547 type:complete len:264 (+) Transcript_6990:301-1092(+)
MMVFFFAESSSSSDSSFPGFLLVVALAAARVHRRALYQSGVRDELRHVRPVETLVVPVVLDVVQEVRAHDGDDSAVLASRAAGRQRRQLRPSDDALSLLDRERRVGAKQPAALPFLRHFPLLVQCRRRESQVRGVVRSGGSFSSRLSDAPHPLAEHAPPPLPAEPPQDARVVHSQVHEHGGHHLVLPASEAAVGTVTIAMMAIVTAPVAAAPQTSEPSPSVRHKQIAVAAAEDATALAEGGRRGQDARERKGRSDPRGERRRG